MLFFVTYTCVTHTLVLISYTRVFKHFCRIFFFRLQRRFSSWEKEEILHVPLHAIVQRNSRDHESRQLKKVNAISHLRRRKQYENLPQSSRCATYLSCTLRKKLFDRDPPPLLEQLREPGLLHIRNSLCVTMHDYNSHLIITRKQFYFTTFFARCCHYKEIHRSL